MSSESDKEKETLATVLAYLKRRGYKETEEVFKKEAGEELIQSIEESVESFGIDGGGAGGFAVSSTGGIFSSNEEALENETVIHNINKAKVYYGLPKEPDISIPPDFEFSDEDDGSDGDEDKLERPAKKKRISKKDFFARRFKSDPNAPPSTRVPFPPLSELEKIDKLNGWKDAMKAARLGPDRLPSICCNTMINADISLCSASFSDDATIMATGYSDSKIRIYSLTNKKLRSMKDPSDLIEMDPEADDVFDKIMDDQGATKEKILYAAHAGPIFATNFTPDKRFMIAACGDGSLRLWNLWLWTNLVNYKGHVYPVSDVEFSPMGYYFASCGADRAGRIWSTESVTPLRLLVGHNDDLTRIHFHPNANYVATASIDRTVRIWDVSTGNCVRYFTGHKETPESLCFSRCGKYLASGGRDGAVHLWDVAMAKEVLELDCHKKPVYSMAFSRDNTVLATSGHDGVIALWNYKGLADEYQADNVSFGASGSSSYFIRSYSTRKTPILNLHFTRRNVLLAVGKLGDT